MTTIDRNNSFIENGILKQCKLDSRLVITGCKKVCGDMEEKDRNNPLIIGDTVFYESLNRNDVLKSVYCNAEIIGEKCFEHCKALEEVRLVNTREIRMMAFMGCSKLKSIVIPRTVEYIEQGAFDLIPGLKMEFEGGQYQMEKLSHGKGKRWFGDGVEITFDEVCLIGEDD